MQKLLVITSCTDSKIHRPDDALTQEDFMDFKRLAEKEKKLHKYRLPAGKMYTGAQHLRLNEGVLALRQKYGSDIVDVYIVSAGYGLISENYSVLPYEITFNTMKKGELLQWAQFLEINKKMEELLPHYDLVFFLLGEKYIQAIQLPFTQVNDKQRLVFICSNSSKRLIPQDPSYYTVLLGPEDAKEFHYGLFGLKGQLFKLFAHEAVKSSSLLEEVYQHPQRFLTCLEPYRQNINLFPDLNRQIPSDEDNQVAVKPKIDFCIPIPNYAKNFHRDLIYFIPECDDRVDPNYDFLNDHHAPGRNAQRDDRYAHELYQMKPNYDGILVSKCNIEQSQQKREIIKEYGLRNYIRFPQDKGLLIGDCGAWTYVNCEVPPYETEEIIDYYDSLGFDIGVSIDHLIAPGIKQQSERKRRYRITLDNAQSFINQYQKQEHNFRPSGVAQGWDAISYRDAVADLIEMGYKHISIGGLAQEKSNKILDIMKAVSPLIKDDTEVHLFGVGRLDLIMAVHKLGITSFDCARPLRQAWGGVNNNYYGLGGRTYAAIRVPQVDYKGGRMHKKIMASKNHEATYQLYKEKEQRSLNSLRLYDKGMLGLEETIEAVLDYDQLVGDGREKHAQLYREVLEEQPWKKCGCEICNQVGIEVIIFRGNNRNRRRGFHNTYVYYKQFKEQLKIN